jgi:hypothetical protein
MPSKSKASFSVWLRQDVNVFRQIPNFCVQAMARQR